MKNRYPPTMRSLRKIAYIQLKNFFEEGGSYNLKQIFIFIKSNNSKLCDKNIMCECKFGGKNSPEWKHQVRWALQDLRYNGVLSYDKEKKEYYLKI